MEISPPLQEKEKPFDPFAPWTHIFTVRNEQRSGTQDHCFVGNATYPSRADRPVFENNRRIYRVCALYIKICKV